MEPNKSQPAQGGQAQQINIKATDEKLKGEYSNLAQIMHTKEEFVIDFLNIFPPTGTLNARIIVSPGHFKRMVKAMEENMKKYEGSFGPVAESEEPQGIGFKA
jgi:hypothetical protein